MSIKVTGQSTRERNIEAEKNFKLVQLYLDDGYTYSKATVKVGLHSRPSISYKWCRDMIEYGETQGYKYKDYKI